MDLYSIEKIKDYTFFKFISWYYQLTPRTIKLLKLLLILLITSSFYLLYHFTQDILAIILYSLISLKLLLLLFLMECLIKLLAKGTGNEKMLEICNSIKECMDFYLLNLFNTGSKVCFISTSILSFLLVIFTYVFPKGLLVLVGKNILISIHIFLFFSGAFGTLCLTIFTLWLSSVGIIRISSNITNCYNEYVKNVYKLSYILSTIHLLLNMLLIELFLLCLNFLMNISENKSMSYPYEKGPFILIAFIFGNCFINLYTNLNSNLFSVTSKGCSNQRGKVIFPYEQNELKNPIHITALVGENIKLTIKVAQLNSISVIIVFIIMFICNLINDKGSSLFKDNKIKVNLFIFPFLITTINLFIETFRIIFIKTKEGIPKGGTDYQEVENIISIFSKKQFTTEIIKFLLLLFIIWLILFQYINNYSWFYCVICYVVGEITYYLIIYFNSKFINKNSVSVRYIINVSQTTENNLISGIQIGFESSIFPSILVTLSLILCSNLAYQVNIGVLQQQINLLYIAILILPINMKFIFINSTFQSKSILYLTSEIIKYSFCNENNLLVHIFKENIEHCEEYHDNIEIIIIGYEFYFSYLSLKVIEYNSQNLTGYEFKTDFLHCNNFVCIFLSFCFIQYIKANLLDKAIKNIQISIKNLISAFSHNAITTNIVERTLLDYSQCVGVITNSFRKGLFRLFIIIVIIQFILGIIIKILLWEFNLVNWKFKLIQGLIMFNGGTLFLIIKQELIYKGSASCLRNAMILMKSSLSEGKGIIGNNLSDIICNFIGENLNSILILLIIEGIYITPFFISKEIII